MILLKMGPMGPRGLGPNPFSTVSQNPFFLFVGILGVPKIKMCFFIKIGVFCVIVAILANVDVNLRLKNCRIAI